PLEARVFYVDDDLDSLSTCTEFLEMKGHRVIETASTLNEALKKIPDLKKKGVNVAILDGNLTERDESGRDGERIAQEIKKQYPEIKVIGHAFEKAIPSADVNCTKMEGGMKLAETVTNI
ncbi:MAG: response regulator, partial [bacterium]|nr:response regulator [bacterium]